MKKDGVVLQLYSGLPVNFLQLLLEALKPKLVPF